MQLMDAHILEEPTAGVLTMQSMLEEKGHKAGYVVRRLMRLAPSGPFTPESAQPSWETKVYLSCLPAIESAERLNAWAY